MQAWVFYPNWPNKTLLVDFPPPNMKRKKGVMHANLSSKSKLPLNQRTISPYLYLQFMHINLFNLMSTLSLGDKNSASIIVDDYSRYF